MYKDMDIITIGEGLIELSSSESLMTTENFSKSYGGDTLVSAISASKSGLNVGYITRVGNDDFGEYLTSAWKQEGLDISQVKLTEGVNGFYFLTSENEGVHVTYYRKKTAACNLSVDDIDFDYIKSAKMVYATGFVQSLSLSCAEVVKEIFSYAKKNNIITAYDVNFSPKVWDKKEAREAFEDVAENIDVLFMNTKKDAPAIFELESIDKISKQITDLGITTAVIKDNNKIYVLHEGQIFEENRIQIENMSEQDLTGSSAGFNGVFMSYLIKGNSPIESLRYAICSEFLQKQKIGAVKSISNKVEIEELHRRIYG